MGVFFLKYLKPTESVLRKQILDVPFPAKGKQRSQVLTGCCPNHFSLALKRFLFINLSKVKGKQFQLVEPKGRVLYLRSI